MALAPDFGFAVDIQRNVIPFAEIEYRREAPGLPLAQLYADTDANDTADNPVTANDKGYFRIYAAGGFYQRKVTAIIGGVAYEHIDRDVPIGNLQAYDLGAEGIASFEWEQFVTPQVITADGDHTVAESEYFLVFNKVSDQATEVILPASAGRERPLAIKDGKGDAPTYNITITPDGSETIDGLDEWKLTFSGQGIILIPRADGLGWWTRGA